MSPVNELRTVRQVIGQRVREIRTEHGRRQEQIADAARKVGLSWDRTRVAGLERGAKALSVEELLRLPLVMQFAGCGSPTLADLFADGRDEYVALDGETRATAGLLRDVLAGERHPSGTLHVSGQRVARGFGLPRFAQVKDSPDEPTDETPAAHREVERRAASRLGVTAAAVVTASRALWGHSLTEERDARALQRDAGGMTAAQGTRLRAQITRELDGELRAALATRR